MADVPDEGAIRVMVDGNPIAVARSDGEVFAIRDVCSHADVALSEGEVSRCEIECWLHGSRFDLRTGKPLALPAFTPVPVYAVTLHGDGDDAVVMIDPTPLHIQD